MVDKVKVYLLASGGIDSTALLDFYLSQDEDLECVHFQYGQPSGKSELQSIEKITEHYDTPLHVIKLPFNILQKNYEYHSRNSFFIIAASTFIKSPARISLAIHQGAPYYDTTQNFLCDCQKILDGHFQGTMRIEAPFLHFTKNDVVKYSQKNDVPIEFTYSCLKQNAPACGICPSCKERGIYVEY